MSAELELFEHTLRNTHDWLDEIRAVLGTRDDRFALGALRASLHAMRDSLSVDEAISFGAQLPMLIRGLYYEGWHPHRETPAISDPWTFLAHVAAEVREEVDAESVVRATCAVVAKHVDAAEWQRAMRFVPGPLYLSGAAETPGELARESRGAS